MILNMTLLNDEISKLLNRSDDERINFILKDHWIGYPTAHEILAKFEFLLNHPRINRMPSILLVGETNNGKTVLLSKLVNNNKPFIAKNEDQLIAPILYVQSPPVPDEKRFYNAILECTYTPYRINDKLDKRLHQVVTVLKRLDVKVLIIDEIQHVLGGSMSKRISFLNVIKYLSNELRISIIGAGTKDAFHAISTDAQLTNRFEPLVLPKWNFDKNYLRLLTSYESLLPLKQASNLAQNRKLAEKILLLSEGTIGEVVSIVKRAAVKCIENKKEFIDEKIIDELSFIPPSQRRYNSKMVKA
ncbi:TniB family NTP-binding protein [Fulvivirga sp.]|uniref:TniB family NTP-binding protein n=1 Tax=Fulvivirga sp. TaxID=1931237 RepID=UPI0032EF913C